MIMNSTAKDVSYFFIKAFSLGFPKNREAIKRFNLETESHTVESKSDKENFYFHWKFKDEFSVLLSEKDSVQKNFIHIKIKSYTSDQVEGILGRLSTETEYIDSHKEMTDIAKQIGGNLVSTG